MTDAIFEPRWWALLKYLPQALWPFFQYLTNRVVIKLSSFWSLSFFSSLSLSVLPSHSLARYHLQSRNALTHIYTYISSKYYRPLSYYGKIETSDNKNQTNVNRRPRGGAFATRGCGRCADPFCCYEKLSTLLDVSYPRHRKSVSILSLETVRVSYNARDRSINNVTVACTKSDVHLRVSFCQERWNRGWFPVCVYIHAYICIYSLGGVSMSSFDSCFWY